MRRSLAPALAFCEKRDLDAWDDVLLAMRGWLQLEEGDWDATAATARRSSRGTAPSPRCRSSSSRASPCSRGDPGRLDTLEQAARSPSERTAVVDVAGRGREGRGGMARTKARAHSRADREHVRRRARAARVLAGRRARILAPESGHRCRRTRGRAGPFAAQLQGDWDRAADEWNEAGVPTKRRLRSPKETTARLHRASTS